MLQELVGKTVTIYLGTVKSFTDSLDGKVIEVKDPWIKLQIKNGIEFINIQKIVRITVK